MDTILFHRIRKTDIEYIELIAKWYLKEWNIVIETTIQKLSNFPKNGVPFQLIMLVNDVPVATAGLHHHVSLLDREPRFKQYDPWLALVYTNDENRRNGYGSIICQKIQGMAKEMEFNEIYLFTHTAEKLYLHLEWQVLERVSLEERNIVVMKKIL